MVGRANHSSLKGWTWRGIYSRVLFYLFLCRLYSFFQRSFLLPHNCGEGTPQLWGNNDKGAKNNFLA